MKIVILPFSETCCFKETYWCSQSVVEIKMAAVGMSGDLMLTDDEKQRTASLF